MPENQDLDPNLLKESGRASAIQDLADQARAMGDRAVALENSTRQALTHQVRRWRRTTIFLSLALLVLASGVFLQISISRDNKEILTDVQKLVSFVEERQGDEADNGPDPQLQRVFKAAIETRELVCASEDPQRVAMCEELGGTVDG